MISTVSQDGYAATALVRGILEVSVETIGILPSIGRAQASRMIELALELGVFIDVENASFYMCPCHLWPSLRLQSKIMRS